MFKVDFVGIGSGKCGSTWFFENLVKHPEVCNANPKELNFFSDLYDKGEEWYASNFAGCAPSLKRGEFSVTYMYNPDAAERIHRHNPDAKIIAIVRDPIGRTYSDYWHFIRKGDIPAQMGFDQYIRDEKRLKFGDYAAFLHPYFQRFPPGNIMVIVLEDFNRDHAKGFADVYRFLGLKDTTFLPDDVSKMVNVGRSYRFLMLEKIMVRTYRFLARGGHTRLAEAIKRTGVPELLRRLNMRSGSLPPMPEACRQSLQEYFGPRNAALAALMGRELTAWR
jgi:hypothetical protein